MACVSLGLAAAGCGSSSHSSSSLQPPANIANAGFRYADCMRNHGVSNFPNPKVSTSGGGTKIALAVPSLLSQSPQFRSAQQACRSILPKPQNLNPAQLAAMQHTREVDLLSFAKCLRDNGLTNFPDPTSQGQLTLEMIHAAGIDLQAPNVLPAAKVCIGASHGAVTGADVARAINGGQ